MSRIERLARIVDDAAVLAQAVPQLTLERALTLEEAYAVQRVSVQRKLNRGEQRVGVKMGFTSRAKMAQMGVEDLIWGRLTDGLAIEEGGEVAAASYIHPRVESEVAFLLKRSIGGRMSMTEALACVEAVAPAMEIIDSRYKDFRFSLPDVIADNTSAAGFVLGPWRRPDLDVSNLGMILEINGRPRQIGSSGAILGHPARSLVAAARLSAEAGEALEAGWIVLAGAAMAAEALQPGDHVRTVSEELGGVGFSVSHSPCAGM